MQNFLYGLNSYISSLVWGPVMLTLILFTGVYLSVRMKFFQLFHFKTWFSQTFLSIFKKNGAKESKEGISQFQAMATVLAGCVGTGNIVGVATAITLGGPGAIFWMWISAFFGMMISFAENVLCIKYRAKDENGKYIGGPMVYMEQALGLKWLAALFCVFCVLASFGIGNMTQVNSLAEAAKTAFNVPAPVSGAAAAVLGALAIFGGISRISKVCEKLVPFMTIFYMLGCFIILILFANALPNAFYSIFSGALGLGAAAGGVTGSIVQNAVRYGVSRGVFSNEAGMGSTVIVNATSNIKCPVRQGMWGIFEVFADTIALCTLSALVILVTGAHKAGGEGVSITVYAFSCGLGSLGSAFVALATILFSYASLLGWSYFGLRGWNHIFGRKSEIIYKLLFIFAIYLGAVSRLSVIWTISDTFNGLMLVPNLITILILSGTVIKELKEYKSNNNLYLNGR